MTAVVRTPGYREIRELGSGAQGRVALACREEDGAYVAIKYLPANLFSSPAESSRFRAEAHMLAQLDDPHIARLHDYIVTGDGAAIVMEFIEGVTLRAILDAWRSRLKPESALVMLKGSLLGLAAAHTRGLIHRDYKPANVIVQNDGTSKLIDFGLAALSGDTAQTGTPAYMAPEQWRGEPAAPSTDIYAATCVFYECLTGHQPYRNNSVQRGTTALRRQHLTAPIPLTQIPPPLRRLVKSGMAKRPTDRPANAAAFLQELERAAVNAYGPDWEQLGKIALVSVVTGFVSALTIGRVINALHTAKHTLTRLLHIKTAALISSAVAATAATTAMTAAYLSQPTPLKTYSYAYGRSHLLTKAEIDTVADIRIETPADQSNSPPGKDNDYLAACDGKLVPLASHRHPLHQTYSLLFSTPSPRTWLLPPFSPIQYSYQESVIVYSDRKQEAADFAAFKNITCERPTTAYSGLMNGWEYYDRSQTVPCDRTHPMASGMCAARYDYLIKANIILAVAWQQTPADNIEAQQTMDRLDKLLLAKFRIP